VVTGLGAISPAGVSTLALWKAVVEPRTFGSAITDFDVSRNKSRIGARCLAFDPVAHGISRERTDGTDLCTQYALVASREAWLDSGVHAHAIDSTRVGVCLGTAVRGVGTMEKEFRAAVKELDERRRPQQIMIDPERLSPRLYAGFLACSPTSEVATMLGAMGFSTTVTTGCTAGIDSIGLAHDIIEQGLADVMVAGGSEVPFTPIVVTAFDNIHCLTTRNYEPRRASRTFDGERDGFLLGEGCGVLVLEREDYARRRRARIYGRVLGYGSVSNAYHMTGLPAQGTEQARAMKLALDRARVNTDDVSYFNAHGTSTAQNDVSETLAFKAVFGQGAYRLPISSTKSVVGHALGAASALASVVCFKAIQENLIPPTANLENPDPACDLDYVPLEAREKRISVVGCNASGFSGVHTSMIYSCFH
jgi:minimal PKS ketosynthase (KS/KS alpha)